MGQSAVKNPRKIFSQAGADPALNNRVTNLENNEYKILYFQTISSTTGTITKPTGATILLDQFYSGGDALVETLSNGQPTGQSPLTIGGAVVSVTSFDTSGNYVLSGTPSAYPVALVYIFKIKAIDLPNLNMTNIMQMDANGYVPYVGAISDVNLGEFGIQLGNLEFDNTPTNIPTTAGSVVWNDTDGTLDLKLKGGNVTLQIGQEQVSRVVNKTATNITLLESNYQAVRVTGAQGQRLKVDLALATNDLLSAETIGLVTETIANNQEGFITTSGLVRNINTTGSLQSETWADGDILYLSPTTAGNITNVKPIAPNHLIIIGYVVYAHINQGSIFVKVDNGYELDELHNVLINSVANNDVLTYDSATSLWKNKQSNYLQIVSKDITDSTALTGTTAITLMKSILIPANTYATGDVVKILNRAIRSTVTGTASNLFYINTTNSLTGATLVGTQSAASRYYANERNLYIKSTTISETLDVATSLSSDANVSSANPNSNLNIDWSVNQYIIAAFQNAAVGNSTVMSSLILQKF
jgi:hypothetical protein